MLFTAMVLVICAWIFLYFVFVGVGCFISRIFKLKIKKAKNLFITSFWMGWSFTIFFLQFWHLFFRIDWRTFVLASTIGSIGLTWHWKSLCLLIRKNLSENWLFYLILALFISWLANRAILPPLNGDSGLYHTSAVHWINSYPIIPGLGNLHGRLAFNNSYFLYVALLDSLGHQPYHLANGLLLSVIYGQVLLSIFKLFDKKINLKASHLFGGLLLYPLLRLGLGPDASSPSPQMAIFALQIVLSIKLLEFLEEKFRVIRRKEHNLFFITTLAFLGITIKLNFWPFSATILLITFFTCFTGKNTKKRLTKKTITSIVNIGVLSLLLWVVRSVILSGYIVYPIIGAFPVEWRIPRASVINMANLIRGWARKPGVHWSEVLGSWDWFRPWATGLLTHNLDVAIPLFLLFTSCFFMLLLRFMKKDYWKKQPAVWIFLLPAVLSLIFWFLTAPDIRFAGACFWILGIGMISLLIVKLIKRSRKILFLFTFIYMVLSLSELLVIGEKNFILNISRMDFVEGFSKLRLNKEFIVVVPGEDNGFYKTPQIQVKKFITDCGLTVYVPIEDLCWHNPLPCTPYPNSKLCLRNKKDIRYGFMVNPRDEKDASVGLHY